MHIGSSLQSESRSSTTVEKRPIRSLIFAGADDAAKKAASEKAVAEKAAAEKAAAAAKAAAEKGAAEKAAAEKAAAAKAAAEKAAAAAKAAAEKAAAEKAAAEKAAAEKAAALVVHVRMRIRMRKCVRVCAWRVHVCVLVHTFVRMRMLVVRTCGPGSTSQPVGGGKE